MKKVFGTREWSNHSFNCVNGCTNNCRYCYAKRMALRYKRKINADDWSHEILINKISKIKKLTGKVMLPTTHDINADNYNHVIDHIIKHLDVGNELLIVTKARCVPTKNMIVDLKKYSKQILFRLSIGTANEDVLKYWEPSASPYTERLMCLQMLSGNGYNTSVSVEPMLWDDIDILIESLYPYVSDSIWIGKMNNHIEKENNQHTQIFDKIYESDYIKNLYNKYRDNTKIKWKESFKKIIGLKIPVIAGLDL